jgi:8-oxo-dGTP diphosphatase
VTSHIAKVGLAFVRDGKLLVVRQHHTPLFLMPGGQPEPGETDLETLAREIQEETSGRLSRSKIEYLDEFSDEAANNPGCIVSIRLYAGSIEGDLIPSAEIGELKWWDSRTDDPSLLSLIVRNKIVPYLSRTGRLGATSTR